MRNSSSICLNHHHFLFCFFFLHRETNMLKRVAQCCLLNGGVFGFSIILFEYGLLPFICYFLNCIFGHNSVVGAATRDWIISFLSFIFGTTWILPLFILSKVVNSLWFQVKCSCWFSY